MSFPAGDVELSVKNTGLFWQVGKEKENLAAGTDWVTTTCCEIEFSQYLPFVTLSVTV
jgi:hypothetical protein